ARGAQAYRASTEPQPWPWSPSGAPAWRAAQETKYAHHGPGPGLPSVAERYWAIRGESFEPGGCSAWPISPCAAATIRAPPLPSPATPSGAVAPAVAPSAPGPIAPCSSPANELEPAWVGAG